MLRQPSQEVFFEIHQEKRRHAIVFAIDRNYVIKIFDLSKCTENYSAIALSAA